MSPEFAIQVAEHARRLAAELPPGGRLEYAVFSISVPAARIEVEPSSSDAHACAAGEVPQDDSMGVRSIDPARMTPLQRVNAHVREHGDDPRKLKDWAALFVGSKGPSGRELTRALKAGVLDYSVKASDKDAGAWMVDPADLLAYLAERERLLAAEHLPEDWRGVLGTRLRPAA